MIDLYPFGPLLAIIGLAFAVTSAPHGMATRRFVCVLTLALSCWYLAWRLTHTLHGPHLTFADHVFISVFLAVELLQFLNHGVLMLTFLRKRDNRPLADECEKALRTLPHEALPAVDVFIPTYNEPLEVLERTILCAKAIDWPNLNVWVLDDGRRDWLRQLSKRHQVGYLTRPDNKGAKAGNINAALARTNAPFILILDADFVAQPNILWRAMGLFQDPRVGIVQMPQDFFNPDPLQHNLYATRFIPNDQRLFFHVIQPSRDAWDAAVCCGTNAIIRRAALDSIGGRFPTECVMEDIFLTCRLLPHGYVTRYLDETLAIGLAPESLSAFIIQRAKWAQGAIQMMLLKDGIFGPGLSLMHRIQLFALPLYWISFTSMHCLGIAAPIILMLTGIMPIANVAWEDAVFYKVPVMILFILVVYLISGGQNHFLLNCILNTFLAARLMPVVAMALIRPFNAQFIVTPKGKDVRLSGGDRGVLLMAGTAFCLTILGLLLNASPDLRIVGTPELIPVTVGWSLLNLIILGFVMTVAEGRPTKRQHDRFAMENEPATLLFDGRAIPVRLVDLSQGGVLFIPDHPLPALPAKASLRIAELPEVDILPLARRAQGYPARFAALSEEAHVALIRKLFSGRYRPVIAERAKGAVFIRLMLQLFRRKERQQASGEMAAGKLG